MERHVIIANAKGRYAADAGAAVWTPMRSRAWVFEEMAALLALDVLRRKNLRATMKIIYVSVNVK